MSDGSEENISFSALVQDRGASGLIICIQLGADLLRRHWRGLPVVIMECADRVNGVKRELLAAMGMFGKESGNYPRAGQTMAYALLRAPLQKRRKNFLMLSKIDFAVTVQVFQASPFRFYPRQQPVRPSSVSRFLPGQNSSASRS